MNLIRCECMLILYLYHRHHFRFKINNLLCRLSRDVDLLQVKQKTKTKINSLYV